jgi:hypothetical protein
MKSINNVETIQFPDFFDKNAFVNNKIYINDVDVPNLPIIRRLDNVSFTELSPSEFEKFWEKIGDVYVNDLLDHGMDFKDSIFLRQYFKEIVIKEQVHEKGDGIYKQIRYWHYSISDYGDNHKQFDDRVLTCTIYTSLNDGEMITFENSIKIFVSHIPFIIKLLIDQDMVFNIVAEDFMNTIKDVPMYVSNPVDEKLKADQLNSKTSNIVNLKFMRLKDHIKNVPFCREKYLLYEFIFFSIVRYAFFNHYMINKVEEEQKVSINNFESSGTIVECVKSKARMDKKIRINLDKEYDIKLNIDPKNKNIYSHDNKIIRRLCDYKFQVCAHWHYYWYGPKNQPELRHKERRWVEAYYKNEDKEFKIIKERYKHERRSNHVLSGY